MMLLTEAKVMRVHAEAIYPRTALPFPIHLRVEAARQIWCFFGKSGQKRYTLIDSKIRWLYCLEVQHGGVDAPHYFGHPPEIKFVDGV